MNKRAILITGTITLSLILAGCFQGEQSMEEEMDPPQDAEAVSNLEDTEMSEEEVGTDEEESKEVASEMVPRELYLIDKNGMVASQTLELPETTEVGKQLMEHLVKGGPIESLLPNGFRAVLPEGTEILGLNLTEDGTMIVDVSEEFKDYEPHEEIQIIEAMTHTLTQFENVERVQLWINGHQQEMMPVNGTPIGEGYTRANGINVVESNVNDLLTATPVTMYYPAEHNENRYYVPVTQYIEVDGDNEEKLQAIVESLLEGPGYQSNVLHVFNAGTALTSTPKMKDGVVELTFNEGILKDSEQYIIADEVMETLVRTLKEQDGVEAINVQVENVEQLVNENGESYDAPVTIDHFITKEEL